MYDQAGMLREMVKWDYEMKRGDQAGDRGGSCAGVGQRFAQGPVYSVCRARYWAKRVDTGTKAIARIVPVRARRWPRLRDIELLADWIAAARRTR